MKKVLVVIDMQNFFITGQLGTPESRAIVPGVVDKIKNFNGAVYVTQDINPSCDEGSESFALYPPVKSALPSDAICLSKRTIGSIELGQTVSAGFGEFDRPDPDGNPQLEIEFCGVCTNVCVISNLLIMKAFLPKAKYVVDSSCCAGLTPELHQKALDVMKSNRIEVI